jgi:hypothetical protein
MTRPGLFHFALLTALLPLVCVHLSYLVAASLGHVPWCVPYWDSCSSISATGRLMPEKLLFKLLMMPAGVCAIAFWWLVRQWLRIRAGLVSAAIPWTGTVAAVFMLLYVAALGESNEYRWARQAGIILFFSLSYVAQLLFLHRAHQAQGRLDAGERKVLRWQLRGAAGVLAIGIGSVLLDIFHARYDEMEDAVEWILMLCISAQFASHGWLWRSAAMTLRVEGRQPPAL